MEERFAYYIKSDFEAISDKKPSFLNYIKLMIKNRGVNYIFWLRMLQFRHFTLIALLMHRVLSTLYGIHISSKTKIGRGFRIVHAIGIVIHKQAVIGDNCSIHQNTTIGVEHNGVPFIGNNVMLGACSCVLGGVKIGNNVKIGAGAVVISDIPDNCTAVGVPAKIINK